MKKYLLSLTTLWVATPCSSGVAPDFGHGGGNYARRPKDAPPPPLFLLRPTVPELRRTDRADLALRLTQGQR